MNEDKKIAELVEQIDNDVQDGFLTVGNAIGVPLAEGHSVAWLVGALTSIENAAKRLRERIQSYEGRDKYEAEAAEIIAKVSCVTEAYSYKQEVESDD